MWLSTIMIQLMVNVFQLWSNPATDLRLFDHDPAVVVGIFNTASRTMSFFFFFFFFLAIANRPL